MDHLPVRLIAGHDRHRGDGPGAVFFGHGVSARQAARLEPAEALAA